MIRKTIVELKMDDVLSCKSEGAYAIVDIVEENKEARTKKDAWTIYIRMFGCAKIRDNIQHHVSYPKTRTFMVLDDDEFALVKLQR